MKRNAEAIWIDSRKRWAIKVQKEGIRKSFYCTTPGRKGKHIAESKADEWLNQGTDDMRFAEAWKLFLEYQQKNTSASNYKKHEQYGRLYLLPNLKTYKLSSVSPIRWQACIDTGAKNGLSRRSLVNIRASITSFTKYALRSRWSIQRIEDGDITIPNSAPAPKAKQPLQPDDIRKLFDDPRIVHYGKKKLSPYSYAWQFLVATGLRRGELAGLRSEDINGNMLTIRRSINTIGEETAGKNDNARRTIELSSVAIAILDKQKRMLRDRSIVSPWVFPDQYGGRPEPNLIYEHWRTWRKQNGIEASIHELRHTFVSINKADMPVELMKAVVGHSTAMDTYGIYGHDIEGERHRAALIVDDVLTSILNG